jgi:hypothetical protein
MDNNQNQYPVNNDNQQPIHRPIVINPTVVVPENTTQPEQPQQVMQQQPLQAPAPQLPQAVPTPIIQQAPQSISSTEQYAAPAPTLTPTEPEQPTTSQGFYNSGNSAVEEAYREDQLPAEQMSWSAPEFVMHEKSSNWFLGLIGITFLIGAFVYLLTRNFLSVGVVVLAIISLGTYSLRRPKIVGYTIDDHGITIGIRRFNFNEFRHFSAFSEGEYISINFSPMKRFSLPVGACFKSGPEEADIIDYLSERLPLEEHRPDLFDSLIQRLHF